jgi:tetratricopeptide (TPR) repeat protein
MKTKTLLALIYLSLFAFAVTPSRADLPPDAQAAVDKGIIAAKQAQDYLLAIRYFQDARKIAPDAPDIYYKLGVAEANISGRELRAICWLEAYLAANPSAPNTVAVKKQIDVLDIKSQSSLSRVIKSVQDSAAQSSDDKQNYLSWVTSLWAESGDITTAMRTANSIQDGKQKAGALESIVEAQAKAGDIVGAQNTANQIWGIGIGDVDVDYKDQALFNIAKTQAEAGDIAGAQKTADLIPDANFECNALEPIAKAQVKAGDIAGAKGTLASVLQNAKTIINWGINNQNIIDSHLRSIAEIQIAMHDFSSAQTTANLMSDANWLKNYVLNEITQASSDNIFPAWVTNQVAIKSVVPIIKVSDWLNKLDDNDQTHDCALNTDPFLDLASYLTSLSSSSGFRAPYDAVEKIVKAQNIIDQMLKQQAKQQAAQNAVKALDDDFEVKKSGDTPHIPPPPPPPN